MSSPSTTTRSSSIRVLPLIVFCLGYVYRLELSRYLNTSNDQSFLPPSEIRYHHNGDHGSLLSSPACRPHYQVAQPNGQWTNGTKFTRLYFYHVRKAGGTTLRRYFEKVAGHHGLEYKAEEYSMAEDPSSHDEATLYVTHLREPISRSISHFKYEGRWNCNSLLIDDSFVPTEDNAGKFETWNQTHGHYPSSCMRHRTFIMSTCAVNCYCQWFSGSCPTRDNPIEVPMKDQYEIAKNKLLRYNFIVITEMLQHPNYVDAVERFFGVPGLIPSREVHPWCEVESRYSNERVPLVIQNESLESLIRQNEIDIGLYHEMRDCLDIDEANDFPAWDEKRFEMNETIQINHDVWERLNPIRGYQFPPEIWLKKFSKYDAASSSSPGAEKLVTQVSSFLSEERKKVPASPACEPHFRVALSDGTWTEAPKFKRLYFYHARKAGGTNLKRYFQKVAAHHGLVFDSDEFSAAEDPGSADDATFYVAHLREPVSRSLSHFKYEGRWNCNQLLNNETFIPSEENAGTLEAWSNNYGRNNDLPNLCARTSEQGLFFHMVTCGVNCYIQWIAGLSCPLLNPKSGVKENTVFPFTQQIHVAKERLLRYNFIVILEMLQNEEYTASVERFFGVPGVAQKRFSPWCEAESHYANSMYPLVVKPDMLNKLVIRNRLDINFYNEFKQCLNETDFGFPAWRGNRFEMNKTIQLDYMIWEQKNRPYWPTTPSKSWLDKLNKSSL